MPPSWVTSRAPGRIAEPSWAGLAQRRGERCARIWPERSWQAGLGLPLAKAARHLGVSTAAILKIRDREMGKLTKATTYSSSSDGRARIDSPCPRSPRRGGSEARGGSLHLGGSHRRGPRPGSRRPRAMTPPDEKLPSEWRELLGACRSIRFRGRA